MTEIYRLHDHYRETPSGVSPELLALQAAHPEIADRASRALCAHDPINTIGAFVCLENAPELAEMYAQYGVPMPARMQQPLVTLENVALHRREQSGQYKPLKIKDQVIIAPTALKKEVYVHPTGYGSFQTALINTGPLTGMIIKQTNEGPWEAVRLWNDTAVRNDYEPYYPDFAEDLPENEIFNGMSYALAQEFHERYQQFFTSAQQALLEEVEEALRHNPHDGWKQMDQENLSNGHIPLRALLRYLCNKHQIPLDPFHFTQYY